MAGMKQIYMPVQVAVRLGPSLKEWLEQRAVQEEMSVSTLIRQLIQAEARRDLVQGSEVQVDVGV